MHPCEVVDRLAAFPLFADVPRDELEWLVGIGDVRACAADTFLFDVGAAIDELYVVLSGQVAFYTNKGGVWRKVTGSGPGRVHGAVPYSRGRASPGRLTVEEDATLFVVSRSHFIDLVRHCPELTATLVHEMVDRARDGRGAQLHDDRLQSLGRLASGLAHELNNPASAASRSALSLDGLLDEAESAARALARARLSDAQLDAIDALRAAAAAPIPARGALELADREDEIADWLARHESEPRNADALASSSVEIADLDRLAAALPSTALGAAIRLTAAGRATRAAAHHIASATGRIHELVDAVKGFTFMDRESVPEDVDVAKGLADTLTVLGNKSRTNSVDVRLDVAVDLPRVFGFGGELNQVWEKLVENAIDAAGPGGHVTIDAAARGDTIVVSVTDDGPGIPEEDRPHVFDPFFTTKPVGQGTGLGLDLARRVVEFHRGAVDFATEPGRTTFRVQLPASGSANRLAPLA